ncbi:MAG: ribosome assembly protein 4, partial [Xenococcaceae cyanobacterium]
AQLWDLKGNLLAEFKGNQGRVWGVAFSRDGELLATASDDRTVQLWDLKGNLLEFKGPQGHVTGVAFSPDGEQLATASDDRTARLWDLKGNLLAEFKGHRWFVESVAFSPDGELLATASSDRTARLWDLKGNLLAELKGHQGTVTSVAFSPDGEQLATASRDRADRLWDLMGNPLAEFKGHQSRVVSVAFSPDGEQLATASSDGTARLWDLKGNLLAEFKGHQSGVISVAFSPDGELLATTTLVLDIATFLGGLGTTILEDHTARLWDLKGNLLAEFKGHRGPVRGVAFSPDGELLATASSDHTARLWRVEGLDELLARGCDWLNDYLVTHPKELETLLVCQNKSNLMAAAPFLLKEGEKQARAGNFDDAVATFGKALKWNPNLDLNPKAEAGKLAAPALIEQGKKLVTEGDVKEALTAYKEAQKLDPTLEISANSWMSLCWFGSLHGHAAEVMDACNKMVKLEPQPGRFRGLRGIAKAKTGDIKGAIEDFEANMDWINSKPAQFSRESLDKLKQYRQSWIDELRAGKNPIKSLSSEEIQKMSRLY